MDRKSLIILAVSIALLFTWIPLIDRIFPPTRVAPRETNTVATATNPLPAAIDTNAPPQISALEAPRPRTRAASPNSPEQTLTLENENARYTFTSHGGGVKRVELKRYLATVECRNKTDASTNALATLNTDAAEPMLALVGPAELIGDNTYDLTRGANSVRAEKVLQSGLRLIKEFRLGTNYLLSATVRLENPTALAVMMPAHELVVGTATPIGLRDESLMLGVMWFDGAAAQEVNETYFANRTLGCLPGQPRTEYSSVGTSNVLWAAVHNQFFTLIAVPSQAAPRLVSRRVTLPPPTAQEIEANPNAMKAPFGFETAFVYPPNTIPATNFVEHTFDLYAGPREYFTLSRLPKSQDLAMGFGRFFGFFAKALLLSMNGLYHTIIPSYGAAIIVITVIIKLLFWPLTTASTRSMKRMAELQPQMKALQEKYKEDPKKMNTKLMEFMKENKVSPLGGCLPMLLQIPVFIGFYQMLQSAIELRGASFLWACDLSQADTVFVIPGMGWIPFFGLPGLGLPINPMPIMMGATMFWQARMTPPSPGMDPVQQKIMKYMPMMFVVFLYNFSAGLTLYWTVQNLLTIAQMKLTKSRKATPVPSGKPSPVQPKSSGPRRRV